MIHWFQTTGLISKLKTNIRRVESRVGRLQLQVEVTLHLSRGNLRAPTPLTLTSKTQSQAQGKSRPLVVRMLFYL